jgi:hypothetical protein
MTRAEWDKKHKDYLANRAVDATATQRGIGYVMQ